MKFIYAFVVGGMLCTIAQILIDKTKLSPARIMVSYVVVGVILTGVGIYEPLVKLAGAGATVPIMGFGYSLAKGAQKMVSEKGWLGVFTGSFTAGAGGIAAAVLFALFFSLVFKPSDKR